MKPYIENRKGEKLEFNVLSRKQKILVSKLLGKMQNGIEDVEEIGKVFYEVLKFNHPQISEEEYEDILDYMEEEYGFAELYEMIGYILTDVFTQVGGDKKINPYLQMKREQANKK